MCVEDIYHTLLYRSIDRCCDPLAALALHYCAIHKMGRQPRQLYPFATNRFGDGEIVAEAIELPGIAKAWELPVVFVVGLRLGCLSHSLLSAEAILADGCRLAGWIANRIDPAMAAVEENLATLRELLPAPCLGVLPHGVPPAQAAAALDVAALLG